MAMRSGRLRHRVVVQSRSLTKDSTFGEAIETWSSNVGLWADIQSLRGRTYLEAAQIHSAATHRIVTRYATLSASTEIRPGYTRIIYNDRIFNILHVSNVMERNFRLEFLCSEAIE